MSVHAWGTVRLIDDAERLRDLLRGTVDFYEGVREGEAPAEPQASGDFRLGRSLALPLVPWSMDVPEPGFVDKLQQAIVGFEIDIERIEGKWKLSQNHPAERREKVIRQLRETGGADEQQIADLMANL